MCKSEPIAAKQTAVVVNQLESSSVEFHGPTMFQSILVTLAILVFVFLIIICCKHYGCCSVAELASRRYDIGRWATGQQNQTSQSPPVIYQSAPPIHQLAAPHIPPAQHHQQAPPLQPAANLVLPPRDQ